jgi:hypothetical protein
MRRRIETLQRFPRVTDFLSLAAGFANGVIDPPALHLRAISAFWLGALALRKRFSSRLAFGTT